MNSADTIFAVASGSAKAAVKMFRISGRHARSAAGAMGLRSLAPRVASLRKIRDPDSLDEIDAGLAIWFPGPASFTGEDCLELQLHGGRAVEQAMLAALARIPNCRPAEPGEFSWRAFMNGKLDLTAIEGLADLIDAETDFQRRLALGQTHGRLFQAASGWRETLLSCLALVEGEIDFEDEADVPKGISGQILARGGVIRGELASALADFSRAEMTREGFCVVILGPPNAGKSSLLNYIADREVAIVTATPGTTRDLIEITLDLSGAPVVLVDTAGLRPSNDDVERIGMERAQARAERAQLILWLDPDDREVEPSFEFAAPLLRIRSKADLARDGGTADFTISTVTGDGVADLLHEIGLRARAVMSVDAPPLLTRTRHRSAVASALAAVERLPRLGNDLELVAEELRGAARCLEALFGRIDSEEVLGDIFARFCVGK